MDLLQERWFYNLSLPFSHLMLEHANKNSAPDFFGTNTSIEEAFKGWNIQDRETLLHTIEMMTDHNGHADSSNSAYAIFARGLPSEWAAHKAEEKSPFMHYIDDMVENTGHLVQSGGIRAWDYSRMSYLARAGVATRFITYTEMLWIHYELSLRAQYFFNNWVQYFTSHFIGWHYWQVYNDELETFEDWQTAFKTVQLSVYPEQFQKVLTNPDSRDIPWAHYFEPIEKPQSMVEISWQ